MKIHKWRSTLPAFVFAASIRSLVVLGVLSTSVCFAAPILNRMILNGTDSSGNYVNNGWDTGGLGDRWSYAIVSSPGIADPLEAPPFALTLNPGTYDLWLFMGAGGVPTSHDSINLYFNGQEVPQISANVQQSSSLAGPHPNHVANSGNQFLSNFSSGAGFSTIPGAGTLTWGDGTSTVTLSDFYFVPREVSGINRVGSDGDPNPDGLGFPDHVAFVQLTVTASSAVPEPASSTLLALGSMFVFFRWNTCRRSQKLTQ